MTERVMVRQDLFELAPDGGGHLIGGLCRACGERHFPRSGVCPYCSAADCDAYPLGTRGKLYLYTVVHSRPPGYRGEVPFGFGVVELPEGLRVVTRLTESDLGRLHFDMPMRLVFVRLHVDEEEREVIGYAFAPAEEGAA